MREISVTGIKLKIKDDADHLTTDAIHLQQRLLGQLPAELPLRAVGGTSITVIANGHRSSGNS